MRDIRYAIRALVATPTVTLTSLLVMALGIGVTTAMFSVANAVLFRPLPYSDPERLVEFGTMGMLEFQTYREQSQAFEGLVSFTAMNKNLHDAAAPERISVVAAERGLFDVLGVRALVGRTFVATDPPNVAVVSEGFWRRRSGASTSLNDWKILLDGQAHTVVGVMPDSFQFPYRTTMAELWIPFDLPRTTNWSQRIDVAVGRVRRGMTIDAAIAELRTIAQRLEPLVQSNPNRNVPFMPLTEAVVGRSRTAVLTLLGAAAMVLLIACANVASLLLARAEGRTREVAVCTALGAGRGRLLKQFLTESLVLALAASVAAVFIALGMTKVLVALAATQMPRAFEISLDRTAFLFLLAIAVLTGLVFGIVPALYATKSDVAGILNATSGRASRGSAPVALNGGTVVLEIALAFVLLTGAGLLLRALVSLNRAPTGIVADQVLTLRIDSRGLLASPSAVLGAGSALTAQGRYFKDIEDRVGQIPGVRAAGIVTRLHVQTPGNTATFTVIGRPQPADGRGAPVRLREASPGYFRALGIPLRGGRLFSDREPGILVNETLARETFPGENPIGRVLNRGTIVGVVGDVRQRLRLPPEPEIYNPLAATGYTAATLVVSAAIPPQRLVGPIRSAIREVNPNPTIFDVQTMEQVVSAAHADLDLSLWLTSVFAVLAFAVSAAGIYGVLSYTVAARAKEFAIRLALGAEPRRVLRLVLAQGSLLIGVGVVIGIAGALALTRFLRALLYEVTPTDPFTFTVSTLVLVAVALIACLNPARRAMAVDPIAVLRRD
jgi:putative ABC transport system permease protein